MMKNRFLAAFALSGLVAMAACSSGEDEAAEVNVDATEQVGAPVTPAPVVTDTFAQPAIVDTAAGVTDTAVIAQ